MQRVAAAVLGVGMASISAAGWRTAQPASPLGVGVAGAAVAADTGQRLTRDQVVEALAKATDKAPADFSGDDLSGLDLSGVDFKQANLSHARLVGTRFV
ncbi:MAG TPA: pentapeptide repeat-containing protein, partial [Gemmatimonadaceae bacterium]